MSLSENSSVDVKTFHIQSREQYDKAHRLYLKYQPPRLLLSLPGCDGPASAFVMGGHLFVYHLDTMSISKHALDGNYSFIKRKKFSHLGIGYHVGCDLVSGHIWAVSQDSLELLCINDSLDIVEKHKVPYFPGVMFSFNEAKYFVAINGARNTLYRLTQGGCDKIDNAIPDSTIQDGEEYFTISVGKSNVYFEYFDCKKVFIFEDEKFKEVATLTDISARLYQVTYVDELDIFLALSNFTSKDFTSVAALYIYDNKFQLKHRIVIQDIISAGGFCVLDKTTLLLRSSVSNVANIYRFDLEKASKDI
jgi:hypothetical protein